MAASQPIRNKDNVRRLAQFFLERGQIRNYALIVLSVHTALRISDLLRLCWDDVFDFKTGLVRKAVSITEKKTGKSKTIALNTAVIAALTLFAPSAHPGRFLIENPRTKLAISRIQAYRIIRTASEALEFEDHVSCHSLRKTFGYHSWKGGNTLATIMLIYNHSSMAITLRYLGLTQDDMNEAYLGLNLIAQHGLPQSDIPIESQIMAKT